MIMWFPYSLPVKWKPESERSRTNDSLADETVREFLVGFYLHNRLTREWEVELHLEEPQWVTAAQQGAFSIGYYPNETSQLSEILCRVRESTPGDALRYCYTHVSRVLSCWSAVKGRGFAILGFRIADLTHEARWRSLPHRPSAERFELPCCEALPESYLPVMAFYREARNSPNDMYRFLCCYKILRLWIQQAEPFTLQRERHEERESGIGASEVTEEMTVLSGVKAFHPELEGIRLDELLNSIAPWHDWAVQALIGEQLKPTALDDYEQSLELASVANLLDLATHRILAAEIVNWQSVN